MSTDRDVVHDDIREIVNDFPRECDVDTISRVESETTIGLSWTSMAHVIPDDILTTVEIEGLMDSLSDEGYVPVIEREGDIRIEVNMSHDVHDRLT